MSAIVGTGDQQSSSHGTGLDRIGTSQLLGAIASVREGRVYELGTEFGSRMPQGSPESFFGFRVSPYRTPKSLTGRTDVGFDFSMEVITASPHLGTHIDGLAHIQCHGRMFGGYSVPEVYDDFGWRVNGMEESRPIIGRGVLVDVAGARGVEALPNHYEVTPDDIEETLRIEGQSISQGDIVLVRTGWFAKYYRQNPSVYFDTQPGVGPEAALTLYERGMAVLGTDTSGTEPIPMADADRTTHGVMLVERGVHLLEIMVLDELAADRTYEFCFAALPLRISGATGSWLRPIALI